MEGGFFPISYFRDNSVSLIAVKFAWKPVKTIHHTSVLMAEMGAAVGAEAGAEVGEPVGDFEGDTVSGAEHVAVRLDGASHWLSSVHPKFWHSLSLLQHALGDSWNCPFSRPSM